MGAPPTLPSARRRDIQGLRAVAVLMVVAFHARLPLPGGFVGVDVFFVISGFVITGMLSREWDRHGRINFGRFYLRRFQRLAPALALVVATTVVLSVVLLSPVGAQQMVAAQTGIAAMFLAANVVIAQDHNSYFDAEAVRNPLLHTWSLSVEEQFYLIFPVLIALAWHGCRQGRARTAPYLIFALIAVVSFGLPAVLHKGTSATAAPRDGLIGAILGFYSPATRFWEFAAGVLLALASQRLATQFRKYAVISGLTGAALLFISAFVISEATPFPSQWTLIPVFGTVLILSAGAGPTNPVSRVLSLRPMVRIGDWSYSIYLWHWPFILFAATIWSPSHRVLVAAAALSVVPAVISFYRLEQPIRNMRQFRGQRARRIVALTVSVPIAVCASTLLAWNAGYWSEGIKIMQATVGATHATDASPTQCFIDTDTPDAAQDSVRPCVFNSGANGKPIYLVGDSTAWHFAEAAIGAGQLLGRPVEIVWLPGCPFKNVFMHSRDKRRDAACRRGYAASMKWLDSAPAGTVVISEINSQYERRPVGLRPAAVEPLQSRAAAQNTGLVSTVQSLERAGHSVILVQAVPRFTPPFDPLRCTWSELRRNECAQRMPRGDADRIQNVERNALRKVAAQTGVTLWDPRELFCADQECSTQSDGLNLYIDSQHITPQASRLLAPSLAETIRTDEPPDP